MGLSSTLKSARVRDARATAMMKRFTAIAVASATMAALSLPAVAAPPVSGAIFTTESTCTGVNLNIYADKDNVYLDGGPSHPGAAGLPDGEYYVQVTEPDGALLGTSLGSADETPVTVLNREFSGCLQLSAILLKASDGSAGYDDTSNSGGVYKVWVSNEASFSNDSTKIDNFKVKSSGGEGNIPQATLRIRKFYDANANGVDDDGQTINGWRFRIQDDIDLTRYTPVDIIVDPDTYTITESDPVEANWLHTTPTVGNVTLNDGDDVSESFGNVCLGGGGGLTLGFWSNNNGKALVGSGDLALLVGLNLRSANGNTFDPANYAGFRTWLLNATATNMAYMLSAQLAAMELNVYNGKVAGSALIYAPGTTSANASGFATVNSVMAEANAELGLHGLTKDGSPYRAYQGGLKNALDRGNNNLNFVQASPCAFSFAS